MARTPPPRLTVVAARDADVAVVLRRGPTDWARLSRWDTRTDEVEHGGWLHARVDGRRCDLSPDGRLFGAFVAKDGSGRGPDGGRDHRRDTWVAISRPPWWRALALWFDGSTWNHGAVFPDAASCALGGAAPDVGAVPPWFSTDVPPPAAPTGRDWTTTTVPTGRRVRDGWSATGDRTWERPLASGGVAVLREQPAGTSHTDAEAALRWGDELVLLGEDASLDVDRAGRALVTRGGRLEVHTGPHAVDVVADLTDQRPDPAPAPAWADRWPASP